MKNRNTKIGVIFLGRKRPGFDQAWGRTVAEEAKRFLEESYYSFFPETVVDDGSLRRAITRCREERCDVLLALQPTMSDGRLAPVMAQHWDRPIVLWATPERPEGDGVSCALVGNHVFAATLRQLGRPFEIVYGALGDARFESDLDDAIRVASASQRLGEAQVGLIGHHAPGFIDMHADPFDLNRSLGVQIRHFGLKELVDAAESLREEETREDVERVRRMGLPLEDVVDGDLYTNSRYYLAMRRLYEEENLDALAVRCWPELPEVAGQWIYLALVRLSEEGLPNAMEGDLDGALCCLIGELLGLEAGYLSDWLGHDRDSITLWHPGNAPLGICEPVGSARGPRLAKHFNVPKPLVVNADLKPDEPVTLFRLWRCDGHYSLMAKNATTIPPERPLPGTNGRVRVENRDVYEWFEELCHAGMPHHLAVFPGHHERLFRRFARQSGIEWVG